MYAVDLLDDAFVQLAGLPKEARESFDRLWDLLELQPWSGDPARQEFPDRNMRTHTFGEHNQGLAVYVILEDQRQVFVIRIAWLDWRADDEPRDRS